MREPRRAAIGLLYEIFGDEVFEMTDLPPVRAFSANELRTLHRMLAQSSTLRSRRAPADCSTPWLP